MLASSHLFNVSTFDSRFVVQRREPRCGIPHRLASKQCGCVFPSIGIQRRIAGILSAYDDLLENCERPDSRARRDGPRALSRVVRALPVSRAREGAAG